MDNLSVLVARVGRMPTARWDCVFIDLRVPLPIDLAVSLPTVSMHENFDHRWSGVYWIA